MQTCGRFLKKKALRLRCMVFRHKVAVAKQVFSHAGDIVSGTGIVFYSGRCIKCNRELLWSKDIQ